MPDRRKDLKASAFMVKSLVAGKRNAARKHATLRMEHSFLQTDNKRQKTALSITENQHAIIVCAQPTPVKTSTRDKEMPRRTNRSHTKTNATQHETRNQRRKLKEWRMRPRSINLRKTVGLTLNSNTKASMKTTSFRTKPAMLSHRRPNRYATTQTTNGDNYG